MVTLYTLYQHAYSPYCPYISRGADEENLLRSQELFKAVIIF